VPPQWDQAWNTAEEKAEGNQATAAEVNDVDIEMILHPEGLEPASRTQEGLELVARLREVHFPLIEKSP
jgi:hypothetical protein